MIQDEEQCLVDKEDDKGKDPDDSEADDLLIMADDFLLVKPSEYESYAGRVKREKEILFTPSMQRGTTRYSVEVL